jgi:hypothetical protein
MRAIFAFGSPHAGALVKERYSFPYLSGRRVKRGREASEDVLPGEQRQHSRQH